MSTDNVDDWIEERWTELPHLSNDEIKARIVTNVVTETNCEEFQSSSHDPHAERYDMKKESSVISVFVTYGR